VTEFRALDGPPAAVNSWRILEAIALIFKHGDRARDLLVPMESLAV
jgi:hypothetical protein